MQFIDFISKAQNINDKTPCPEECEFKKLDNDPIVGVPEPQNKLLGVIISRDPTTAFITPYLEARKQSPEAWHHQLMTANAPPQWLIGQIAIFNKKYLSNQYDAEIERLRDIMENNVYWTHLHKCCTDKQSIEAPRFKTKNAMLCADQWLKQELSDSIGQGAKFIICLGNDAKAWFSEWGEEQGVNDKVIYLPHPSRAANGAWNPTDEGKKRELEDNVEKLLQHCRTN